MDDSPSIGPDLHAHLGPSEDQNQNKVGTIFRLGNVQRQCCEGNRQEGQGSPNGGNRLQVSDTFNLS